MQPLSKRTRIDDDDEWDTPEPTVKLRTPKREHDAVWEQFENGKGAYVAPDGDDK